MPNFQCFTMVFNGNFEEVENFFLGGHKKIFLGRSRLEWGHKKIEYGINFYTNKTGKIINFKISNPIKVEYNKFIKNFIIQKNIINKSIMDKIFFLNKASTMILSTTGSEIDILAFIKYLFENEPNPMIYL